MAKGRKRKGQKRTKTQKHYVDEVWSWESSYCRGCPNSWVWLRGSRGFCSSFGRDVTVSTGISMISELKISGLFSLASVLLVFLPPQAWRTTATHGHLPKVLSILRQPSTPHLRLPGPEILQNSGCRCMDHTLCKSSGGSERTMELILRSS